LSRRSVYHRLKKKLQVKYREEVLDRFNHQCCVCFSKEHLHLHHITPVIAFVKRFGVENMEMAYRRDNMVCLCSNCHRSYHKKPTIFVNGKKPAWDRVRARKVVIRMNEFKKARGWFKVDELKDDDIL